MPDIPSVESEVALEYQNLCITHLMSLSGDEAEVQDEDLLAAAVILRFYEEIDGGSLSLWISTWINA